MHGQIVGRPVGTTDTLDPSTGVVNFGIPTVGGIVRHLIGHVLSEPKAVGVDTDFQEVEVDSSHEISKGLISNDTFGYSLPDAHLYRPCATRRLYVPIQEDQDNVLHFLESWMGFVLRIDKVFDFSHSKFTNAK